jgi:Immunity protein Imm1
MFISKYSIWQSQRYANENWESNRNNGLLQEAKDWPEVETAIRELDGHHRTLVTLETESETHMSIGGGNGKYFVYTTFDNENFNYLVNRSNSDKTETLVIGGQEGLYPARSCVDLTTTIKAAKVFAELGIIEKSLEWEGDGIPEPVRSVS